MGRPDTGSGQEEDELKRLRESEARFRMIAESVQDIIVQFDAAGVVEYVSPSAAMLGFRPDEMVGRHANTLLHPDDQLDIAERFQAVARGEPLASGPENEFRVRRAGGGWAWVQGTPSAVFDDTGQPRAVVTILRDVTERHRLAEELRQRRAEQREAMERLAESELRYRMLAEQSPDVIIRYDVDGWVDYVSPAIRQYGLEPGELLGRNVADLIEPDQQARSDAWMADLAAGRPLPQGSANVWPSTLPDGRLVHWEGATNPIIENGRVVGAMSVLRDVSERVRLEAALAAKHAETERMLGRLAHSEAELRGITDAAADLIVRVELNDVIAYASPAARLFGYAPEELVGRTTREFVHPDDRDGSVRKALLAGEDLPSGADNQFRLRRKDGSYAWVEGSPSALRDQAGQLISIVSLIRDITQQVALEDELRRKRAEAEAAAVAKSEFLANMSHEIRTPLTAIVGFSGLLAKSATLLPTERAQLDRILRSADSLTAVVNNILDFSKIEAGQAQITAQAADPVALVECALDLVRDEATAKGLSLGGRAEADMPSALIMDPDRLRQVLLNLLTNAVKYTAEGGIVVSCAYGDGHLRLEVSDTGEGVPADQADRLFQRFSQIDGSNARRHGGTGLGLAISKGLVELMGGQIGYRPRDGGGAVFWLAIPAAPGELPPPARAEADPEAEQALKVLVVDDSPVNRELVLALLGSFPVEAREAADGHEAVAMAMTEAFDVILMDLQMPVMDGIMASRTIRDRDGPNRATPIIAVSASVQPADVEACRQAGMNDHVPKPISPRELLGKIALWTSEAAAALV